MNLILDLHPAVQSVIIICITAIIITVIRLK